MRCEVTGISEITAKFEALRQVVREGGVSNAVRKASKVMAREMNERANVLVVHRKSSTALDPGALKGSIRVSVRKYKNGIVIALIGPKGYPSRVAHLVEYGHRLVKGGKSRVGPKGAVGEGKEIGDVPEHPFLRPAYEATAQRVLEAFNDEIKLLVGEVLK
jgi:HK97 gp10 family phage protein